MTTEHKHLNQDQFGQSADAYVKSTVHAKGASLNRLLEITDPQPEWTCLDVATGGGHTALMVAPHVDAVIASDLTRQMVQASLNHAAERQIHLIGVQTDAEALPFPDATFDLVTCRIAPHHFGDIKRFVAEAGRVTKPGGMIAVIDNVSSGEPRVARYYNAFEALHDPSHSWAYSEDDWRAFFLSTELQISHTETFQKSISFDSWAERMKVSQTDYLRLQTMLLNAPTSVAEWLEISTDPNHLSFVLREFLIIAVKPEAS